MTRQLVNGVNELSLVVDLSGDVVDGAGLKVEERGVGLVQHLARAKSGAGNTCEYIWRCVGEVVTELLLERCEQVTRDGDAGCEEPLVLSEKLLLKLAVFLLEFYYFVSDGRDARVVGQTELFT